MPESSSSIRPQSSRRQLLACASLAGAALALPACSAPASAPSGRLTVFATTGYLADAVHVLAPDAKVTTMVGPGGDPHTYQPSTSDISAMQAAELTLWNGLHLEAQMIPQLQGLGESQLCVGDHVAAGLLLDWPEAGPKGEKLHDPHIWNSPDAWSQVVRAIAERIARLRPAEASQVTSRRDDYLRRITAAKATATRQLAAITGPRVLITGHDAFNYLGKTFDLEVHATDFVTTEASRTAAEIRELAELIATRKVPVIFQDNQVNPQAITSLKEAVEARGWKVRVSTEELYADSLGAAPEVDTYLEVFTHNTRAIAEALGSPEAAK